MYLDFVFYLNLQFLQVFDNLDSNLSKMHKKQAMWNVLLQNRAQHVQDITPLKNLHNLQNLSILHTTKVKPINKNVLALLPLKSEM